MKRLRAATVLITAVGLAGIPAVASASSGHGSPVTTVASGLSGPRQVNDYPGDRLVVAESDSGEVSAVDLRSGKVTTLLKGLFAPQGVAYADGLLYVAVGAQAPDAGAPAPPPGTASSA